ncbi:MAG: exosome non-catalytic core subunit rrp40 [Bathelium mastoideum]|nr:MAG: exosome non-catalytic core subunit rrp40 [Bathelium mastoideum]
MATATVVLPGDVIPGEVLPTAKNPTKPLSLGPGLQHDPPNTITAVLGGELCVDERKYAIWVESNGGRYVPAVGDLVIVVVHHSSADFYHCAITPYTTFALLPQLAFEGATRKTRPVLTGGNLVYARVSLANKFMEPELECIQPATGKADGLGPLKGGMLFDISLGMARRLMFPKLKEQGRLVVLEELAERVPYEIAVGRNGKLWVNSSSVRATLAVGKAVRETDERSLGIEEQKKLVKNLLKTI